MSQALEEEAENDLLADWSDMARAGVDPDAQSDDAELFEQTDFLLDSEEGESQVERT